MTRMSSGAIKNVRLKVAVFAAASASKVAFACPVCFGALEGPVADGTNKAVLALLGVTGGVLVAFATFFIYLYRRARVAAPAGSLVHEEAAGRVEGHVMEGTA